MRDLLYTINPEQQTTMPMDLLLNVEWQELFSLPNITSIDRNIASIALASFHHKEDWESLDYCFQAFLTQAVSEYSMKITHPESKDYNNIQKHEDLVFVYENYILPCANKRKGSYRHKIGSYFLEEAYNEYIKFYKGKSFNVSALTSFGYNDHFLYYYSFKTEDEFIEEANRLVSEYKKIRGSHITDTITLLLRSMMFSELDMCETLSITQDYISERDKDKLLGNVVGLKSYWNRLSAEEKKDPYYNRLKRIVENSSIVFYEFIESANYILSINWNDIITDTDLAFLVPKMSKLKDKYALGDFLKKKIEDYYK